MKLIRHLALILLPVLIFSSNIQCADQPNKKVILFVWDGLRPDSVTPETTPNLYKLMQEGVQFTDNHASYPTFTMMNAASFASGDFAGKTGFFGNVLWHPNLVTGSDCTGKKVDLRQPVFTEDYKVLQSLDQDQLVLVNTLFDAAHKAGLTTAAVGKSGPAFFQDYKSQGFILDEKHAYPLTFAQQLQKDGYAIPKLSPLAYAQGECILDNKNGDPTAFGKPTMLEDGVTTDPTNQKGSPYAVSNQYLMDVYLNEILAKQNPGLSVVWIRDPDTTEHTYGPGSPDHKIALSINDKLLGNLINKLKTLGLDKTTDLMIVSDHAHSNVSGAFNQFPLRNINSSKVGEVSSNGYSVSGDIRAADMLTKAGFHAYDGEGCRFDPILSGVRADKKPVFPIKIDIDGSVCGTAGMKYTTPAYKVPSQDKMPSDAIIVAANGGSDYFYVPSHDKTVIKNLVQFLQAHEVFGAVFVNETIHDELPGTLPLSLVHLENMAGRSPDVIAGLTYDSKAKINNLPGIEFSDSANYRGMHGSFSPIDVHNFLIAYGPDFKKSYQDKYPSGNVDVAPTIARILNLNLANTDGRVLQEALINGENNCRVKAMVIFPISAATKLKIVDALDQETQNTNYTFELDTKMLTDSLNHHYIYFDDAKALRK